MRKNVFAFINNDLLAGIIGTIVLGVGGYRIKNIPLLGIQAGLGPAFFPLLILILLSILTLVLLIKGFIQVVKTIRLSEIDTAKIEPKQKDATRQRLQKFIYFFGVILFPILFSQFGLLISIAIFLIVVFIVLNIKMKLVIFTTLGASLFFYVFFGLVFNIRMF